MGLKMINTLADCVTFLNGDRGKNYPKQVDFVNGEVPFITASDLSNNTLSNKSSYQKKISKDAYVKLRSGKVVKKDILLCLRGSLGKLGVVSDDMTAAIASSLVILRPKDQINSGFLLQWLKSPEFQQILASYDNGSVQGNLSVKNISTIAVPNFSPSDQKAIAHILGALDDKIELNQEMNKTLEQITKVIFKSWFVDFDPVREKVEGHPTCLTPEISSLFPEKFVDSKIGKIPRGWEVLPLNKCGIEIESGRRPKGGIDKTLDNGIPSVGAESIAPAGEFDFSKVKYVTAEFANKMNKGRVHPFDVALYKDGGKPGLFIPRVGIYGNKFPFEHFYVNEHVFLLRSRQLGQPFLYRLVSSDTFLGQLMFKGSAKAAQPGLNQNEVIESTFVIPSHDVIKEYNTLVEPLLKHQFLLGKENMILAELRDALLPKLISGELRIPDAEKFLEEAGI